MNVIMKLILKELILYSTTDFTVKFLEEGSRRKNEKVMLNQSCNGQSNNISHFVVA